GDPALDERRLRPRGLVPGLRLLLRNPRRSRGGHEPRDPGGPSGRPGLEPRSIQRTSPVGLGSPADGPRGLSGLLAPRARVGPEGRRALRSLERRRPEGARGCPAGADAVRRPEHAGDARAPLALPRVSPRRPLDPVQRGEAGAVTRRRLAIQPTSTMSRRSK